MSFLRVGKGPNFTVYITALCVTAVDALTKAWARTALANEPMHVVAGLWLRLSYNAGMSFSFGTATPQLVLYVTLAVALVVLVVGSRASAGAPTTGFGLVLGGALGNVIDRLAATPHTVTDFISAWRFPTFNVADAAITIGAIILTYEGIRGKRLVRR